VESVLVVEAPFSVDRAIGVWKGSMCSIFVIQSHCTPLCAQDGCQNFPLVPLNKGYVYSPVGVVWCRRGSCDPEERPAPFDARNNTTRHNSRASKLA
jgi:hypothetical protein